MLPEAVQQLLAGIRGEESQNEAPVKAQRAHQRPGAQGLTLDLTQEQSHSCHIGWDPPGQGWRREKLGLQLCLMAFVLGGGPGEPSNAFYRAGRSQGGGSPCP